MDQDSDDDSKLAENMANINNYILDRYKKDNMMKAKSNLTQGTGRYDNENDDQINSLGLESSEIADEIESLRYQIKLEK